MRTYKFFAIVALSWLGVTAKADTLYFTYTGTSSTNISDTLTFTLPSSPAPFLSGGQTIFNTMNGNPSSFDGSGNLGAFLSFSTAGGFYLDGSYGNGTPSYTYLTASLGGPQLFAVSDTGSPVLLPGTYDLSGGFTLQALTPNGVSTSRNTAGTLTIAATPAGVTPEPGSIALLGTGLLGLGGVLRKRATQSV